ncbi:hypothetical protein [Arthrobacter sp. Br18]|uniref:hypothetical protein n=1 Tax=Arthrobacter sp. Br18 TaxID=1312954 RepID=UPI0020A6AF70|nr:hypothetical protein [Arthrobacter sp. Br18]
MTADIQIVLQRIPLGKVDRRNDGGGLAKYWFGNPGSIGSHNAGASIKKYSLFWGVGANPGSVCSEQFGRDVFGCEKLPGTQHEAAALESVGT